MFSELESFISILRNTLIKFYQIAIDFNELKDLQEDFHKLIVSRVICGETYKIFLSLWRIELLRQEKLNR